MCKNWPTRASECSPESHKNRNGNSAGTHVKLSGHAGQPGSHYCLSETCFSVSLLLYCRKYLHSMLIANLTFECLKWLSDSCWAACLTNATACFPRHWAVHLHTTLKHWLRNTFLKKKIIRGTPVESQANQCRIISNKQACKTNHQFQEALSLKNHVVTVVLIQFIIYLIIFISVSVRVSTAGKLLLLWLKPQPQTT